MHTQISRTYLIGIAVLATAFLSGCAGTNFVKPDPASFVLGQTTQQEIIKKMGKPYRAGTLEKNGVMLDSASYAYANVGSGAIYDGVTAARSQGFYYQKGTLVGTEYTSSFKEDGTDFDEKKVSRIVKGKTTKAEVVQLFGAPGGEYMAPLVPGAKDRGLVYLYVQTKGSAFNLRIYKKSLVVTYNQAGIVTNVEYVAEGTKD